MQASGTSHAGGTRSWLRRTPADRLEDRNGKLDNLSLIVTFDATSLDRELSAYKGPLAFGPRRPPDKVPGDPRIMVVFPEHHNGHTIPGVPAHPRDA